MITRSCVRLARVYRRAPYFLQGALGVDPSPTDAPFLSCPSAIFRQAPGLGKQIVSLYVLPLACLLLPRQPLQRHQRSAFARGRSRRPQRRVRRQSRSRKCGILGVGMMFFRSSRESVMIHINSAWPRRSKHQVPKRAALRTYSRLHLISERLRTCTELAPCCTYSGYLCDVAVGQL